jgi:hypothetical protein
MMQCPWPPSVSTSDSNQDYLSEVTRPIEQLIEDVNPNSLPRNKFGRAKSMIPVDSRSAGTTFLHQPITNSYFTITFIAHDIYANMDSSNILQLLDQLDDEVDDLEEALSPILEKALSSTVSKLPILDKAKLYVLVTYAIESILFCQLLCRLSIPALLT